MATADWNCGEQSALVSIGDHSLHLNSYGPDRQTGQPVVICIPGLASSIRSWAAVVRLLKPHVRTYTYDRSGFGESEESPSPPSSTNNAHELSALLQNAKIVPPYIFVAHSWGGILVREYLHLQPHPERIASLIFVDANHDDQIDLIDWRHPAFRAMAENLDLSTIPAYNQPRALDATEWDIYQADIASPKHKAQAEKEWKQYDPSFGVIKEKGQLKRVEPLLGDNPVSVLVAQPHIGFQQLYDAGIAAGNGTSEERAIASRLVSIWKETHERLQGELRTLSRNSHFRVLECGHDIQELQPATVVDEVLWVLGGGA